jgi:hypothetical protein
VIPLAPTEYHAKNEGEKVGAMMGPDGTRP